MIGGQEQKQSTVGGIIYIDNTSTIKTKRKARNGLGELATPSRQPIRAQYLKESGPITFTVEERSGGISELGVVHRAGVVAGQTGGEHS